jgi:hypothetical protein
MVSRSARTTTNSSRFLKKGILGGASASTTNNRLTVKNQTCSCQQIQGYGYKKSRGSSSTAFLFFIENKV